MSEPLRSADVLVLRLLAKPELLDEAKSKPDSLRTLADEVTRELPPPAWVSDRWTYRIVVGALGVVCISAIIGAIHLGSMTINGAAVKIPDVLTALGSAAIGALAGILAPSPGR